MTDDPTIAAHQEAGQQPVASVAALVELIREHLMTERAPFFATILAADILQRGLPLAQYSVISDAAVKAALMPLPEPKRVLRKDPPAK